MKKSKVLYILFGILFLGTLGSYATITTSDAEERKDSKQIGDTPFDKMMAVLTHQRCINCHPAGDQPIKGENSHMSRSLGVPRGVHGLGTKGLNCMACHGSENNDYSGVPGAPHWALAPETMKWEGLTRVEIARSMMDTEKNGGRTADDIMKHLTEDELVLWAWNPGVNSEGIPREKPPVPKDEFIAAVKAWIAAGAVIPEQ